MTTLWDVAGGIHTIPSHSVLRKEAALVEAAEAVNLDDEWDWTLEVRRLVANPVTHKMVNGEWTEVPVDLKSRSAAFELAKEAQARFVWHLNGKRLFRETWVEETYEVETVETVETTEWDVIEVVYDSDGKILSETKVGTEVTEKVIKTEAFEYLVSTREYEELVYRTPAYKRYNKLRAKARKTMQGQRVSRDRIEQALRSRAGGFRKKVGMHDRLSAFGYCSHPVEKCPCVRCDEGRANWSLLLAGIEHAISERRNGPDWNRLRREAIKPEHLKLLEEKESKGAVAKVMRKSGARDKRKREKEERKRAERLRLAERFAIIKKGEKK